MSLPMDTGRTGHDESSSAATAALAAVAAAEGASPAVSRPRRPAGRPKPVRKAANRDECETLEQLPNIGPALARDLRSIGIGHPRELAACDGFALYRALCEQSGRRHDPCVLDTFLAVTDFMRGAPPAPWWVYTARRKREFDGV